MSGIVEQQVPKGYQQTEAGIIPEDWEDSCIGDVAEFVGGSQPPKSTFKASASIGYIRLVQIRDYKKDTYITYIPEVLAQKRCEADDIMIGRYGPPIFQILRGIKGAYNVALIKAIPNTRIVKEFLYYTLKAESLFQVMEILSQRSSGQTGVDLPALKAYPLALPSKKEQIAIANALSDVDALITSLEKLIAKKNAIKTAAMQQLLTGKQRLPGFSNLWVEKILGEFGACYRGVSYKPDSDLFEYDTDNSFRLLRSNNVQNQRVLFSNMQYVVDNKVSQTQTLRNDDVLICMANGSKDLVGKAGRFKQVDGYRYTFGAFMGCYRPDVKKCDPKFVFYLFQTNQFKQHIGIILSGSSINNLRPSNIEGFSIKVPADKSEQSEISSVLSDMDKEIDTLEKRLKKTRKVRQGMMQELLAGKARLV